MKTNRFNKVLCFLLSMLMLFSLAPITTFAVEPEDRTFIVEANKTEVYAGEEVTVTVRVDGNEIYGADWTLTWDDTKFALDENSKPLEFHIVTGKDPLSKDTVIATYKFTAIAQTTDNVKGNFSIADGAIAQTRLEAVENQYVAPIIEDTDVTIRLRDTLTADVQLNGSSVEGQTQKEVTYTDGGNTIDIVPSVPTAKVAVKVNDQDITDIAGYDFTAPGTYVIKYTVTEDGYVPVDESFTLIIKEATIAVTAKFDNETAADGGSKEITFDGNAHTFALTSEPTADIKIKVGNGEYENKSSVDFTDVGTYNIAYTVTKTGHTPVNGTYTVVINEAAIAVTAKFDNETAANGGSKEITFDGNAHTFALTSEPTADIKIKVGNGEYESKSSVDFTDVGTYNIAYTVTKTGHTPVNGTYTVEIKAATFDIDVKFDGVDMTANEVKELEYDGNVHKLEITSTPDAAISVKINGEDKTLEDLKDITGVGDYEVEYTISKEGYTTVNEKVTIKITKPVFAVEVNLTEPSNESDYVSGKKIVLVYTNNDKVSFTYGLDADELTMYDVTSKGYTYERAHGNVDFVQSAETKVYAVVVNAVTSGIFADYGAKINVKYNTLGSEYVIAAPTNDEDKYNVNGSNGIDIGDPITAYGVFWGEANYYPAKMAEVLKSDFDNNKKVDGVDTTNCALAFQNK